MATLIRAPRTILALAAAVLLAGCANPFAPATPQPPDTGGITTDFSTPENLVQTLDIALENRQTAGRQAWLDALADSSGSGTREFYAFQDPRVLADWRLSSPVAPPDPWDREQESLFYNDFVNLFAADYDVRFEEDLTSPADDIDNAAGTALLHRRYVVETTIANTTVAIAVGYVDLYLVRYDGRWFVTRWDDRLDADIGVSPQNPENRTLGWRRLDSVSS